MPRIATVQFNTAGKIYDFIASDLDLSPGDKVIVETERGICLGFIVSAPAEREQSEALASLSSIRRKATAEDLFTVKSNTLKEKEAYVFCVSRIMERSMPMKLVQVEYLFDGSKAIFFFTADGRVDFRELVKDLAHTFHTRIEMRQIGVRDESKMVGGLGICGRELCCCSFLREFQPVSVKMAKEQNLALNPNKISGQCGRLLCCLDYEYDTYCSLKKNMPKCGKRVRSDFATGVVEKMNILTGEITLKQEDGKSVVIKQKDILDDGAVSDKPDLKIASANTENHVQKSPGHLSGFKENTSEILDETTSDISPAAESSISTAQQPENSSGKAQKKFRFRKHKKNKKET